eukprot:UN25996
MKYPRPLFVMYSKGRQSLNKLSINHKCAKSPLQSFIILYITPRVVSQVVLGPEGKTPLR